MRKKKKNALVIAQSRSWIAIYRRISRRKAIVFAESEAAVSDTAFTEKIPRRGASSVRSARGKARRDRLTVPDNGNGTI